VAGTRVWWGTHAPAEGTKLTKTHRRQAQCGSWDAGGNLWLNPWVMPAHPAPGLTVSICEKNVGPWAGVGKSWSLRVIGKDADLQVQHPAGPPTPLKS
jgi:hypothetical protein